MTLERNFIWMLISQAIFSAGQWLIVILLARAGGAQEVGYYGFALVIATPIMIFFNLSLRTVYVTHYEDTYDFRLFWRLRILSFIPACLTTLVVVLIIEPGTEQSLVIFLVMLSKIFEASSDMFYALPQRVHRLDFVSKSMILRAVFGTAIFAIAYWISGSLVIALVFYSLTWLVVLITYDRSIIAGQIIDLWQTKRASDFAMLWPLLKLSIPMGLASTLTAIAISAPRFVLERTASVSELGIFAALTYFVMLGNLIVNVLGQTSRSPLASAYDEANFNRFWSIVGIGSGIAIVIGLGFWIGTILIGQWILLVIYGQEFAAHYQLFRLIGLLSLPIFLGGFLGFCLSCMGSYFLCLICSMVILFASICGSLLFIPNYQMTGATYATALMGVAACLQILPMFWRWKIKQTQYRKEA